MASGIVIDGINSMNVLIKCVRKHIQIVVEQTTTKIALGHTVNELDRLLLN